MQHPEYHSDSTDSDRTVAPADVPDRMRETAGPAMLVVVRGPHVVPGTQFPLCAEVTTLGRQPDSTITLDDVTVSRHHAEIRGHGTSFVLVDQGSLNGTYLNRRPVDEAPLTNGDEIQVGKYRLTFWTDDAFAHQRSGR